ncbi:ABC transporter ATP-binding protein [Nocardioides carbamazepini]|uniref:ABC transporter ATP-binding protein n=1 Tax=Nocardioides carbamazepini TaxID=2854259 RepID=UPI00214A2510|nr:ABC transporter ATP-binding protein [Nocardioides carbamazepini]MCR1785646.1 ABC transporter ATP-binding protein [Nocardioides carbamazepini]
MLELHQVEVAYNKTETAVRGVSLKIEPGKTTALLGTNGAGKTTTLTAISGFLGMENAQVVGGQITFDGKRIDKMAPHRISRLGISLVPERSKVFDTLTVADNVKLTARSKKRAEGIYEEFPRLGELAGRTAGYLSGGEKQLLALAMALMTEPEVLLVDELSLGLAPRVTADLLSELQRVQVDRGLTVLLVEQNAAAALQIADYAYVMEDGRVVHDGTPEALMSHGDIVEFYLGTSQSGDTHRSYRDVKQYRRKRRWAG